MAQSPKIAVVGLGNMGLPMAALLAHRQFDITGFDVSSERVALAVQENVPCTHDLTGLLQDADIIIASLPNDSVVEKVFLQPDGLLARTDRRAIVIDTSTVSPGTTRHIATLMRRAGHGWLDAPVSGGATGARDGKLTMMVGGTDADLADVRTVTDVLAARVLHVGSSGAGNVAKLVNNMLVAAHMLTAAEALRLGQAAGVQAGDLLKVINASTGRSAVSENTFPRWVLNDSFDSGFSAGLMRKDVALALSLARDVHASLPLSTEVERLWNACRKTCPDSADFTRVGSSETQPA
ncbi:NAD(P)-dependent oxidoreductase [Komagataeibacter medellinensis]|uniref:3-hydroxyisobutyrate dehydrogenase n=1 Tax=Komagataeibacter medellinensis (strain NBRC 3288 / BCRC 11682 / LMG 1693 / Kondo 51) TaxID=634177 RepID=G2I270_KOMMN|nr:NAD(P)-dependent oxidoreductase [Komagataeibacter medellinensis]BAK82486.1 3-hydroxyisobutyrate dehydrogenase [Komagataeibacter medellinensis NBRC 3288]